MHAADAIMARAGKFGPAFFEQLLTREAALDANPCKQARRLAKFRRLNQTQKLRAFSLYLTIISRK